jgi:hypothetical protein
LTTVELQEMWAAPDLRPSPVMVWLPSHIGEFLDFIEGERLFALLCLVGQLGESIVGVELAASGGLGVSAGCGPGNARTASL